MRNRWTIIPRGGIAVLLVSALIVTACSEGSNASTTSGEGYVLEPIRPAPGFVLETLDGDSLSSEDLESTILMNFWASWCGPCRAEIPDLIELHEAYLDQPFTILGVTVNDIPGDSREFAEEMEMPYPSVIGTPMMLEEYHLSPWLPTTILIKDGEIVSEWVGPRTRADFEYPIRVALGLAPDLTDVLGDETEAEAAGAR